MEKYVFNYAEYIFDKKQACTCNQTLACVRASESHEEGWLEQNNCACPEGDKSRDCDFLEKLSAYEELYGNQDGLDIKETRFYKNYLSKFHFEDIRIRVPDDLRDEFDYDLLYKLIVSSFSSEYTLTDMVLIPETILPDLYIHVKYGEHSVSRSLSELDFSQTLNLFYIYVAENIGLFVISGEDEEEEPYILKERQQKIDKWNRIYDRHKCKSGVSRILDPKINLSYGENEIKY